MNKNILFVITFFFIITIGNIAYAAKPITVGVKVDSPPIAFLDERGHYRGVAIEIFRSIAEKLNLNYKFVQVTSTYDHAVDDVVKNSYDILIGAFSVTGNSSG